jgi:hypothetical protein
MENYKISKFFNDILKWNVIFYDILFNFMELFNFTYASISFLFYIFIINVLCKAP